MPRKKAKLNPEDAADADDREFNAVMRESTEMLAPLVKIEGEKHDLTMLTGIGPETEAKLNDIGINSFSQLAEMTEDHADAIDTLLILGGRPIDDEWQDQAVDLLNAKGEEEPEEAEIEEEDTSTRDLLDRSRKFATILSSSTAAQFIQGQKYFGTDGVEMTPEEAELPPLPPPHVPASRRRRSRYDTKKVNLTAWARGLKRYPSGAIFDTLQDRYNVVVENELDAIDFMVENKIVLPHELHRAFVQA